jgi:diaminohydroxyphosphoribosylaminopyrimidine deaminase/5-amino-6-(5-phosphoribosylamino)uracil reductase
MGIHGEEISISNALSKRYTHQLRAQHQAILVGKNTILADNPELTVRYWDGKNPIRIILGNENNIPKDYHIFDHQAPSLFLSGDIHGILKQLAAKNIISILVEGGAHTIAQFIEADLWNEAHIISSNVLLKDGISARKLPGIPEKTLTLEDNIVQQYKNNK